jgi:hypothetical protein
MKDGYGEFNVAKMSRTLGHVLAACRTSVGAVDAAQLGIVQALFTWSLALLVHSLWVLDVANTHVLSLFRGEETELNLLHRLQRRLRVGEARCGRHGGGCVSGSGAACARIIIIQAIAFQSGTRCRELRVNAALVCCRPLMVPACCSSAAACVHPFDTAQSA